MVADTIGREIGIEKFFDYKKVFDIITKDGNKTERRLKIDLCALRESYSCEELARIGWIRGGANTADELTKETLSSTTPLCRIMLANTIEYEQTGWASVANKKDRDPVYVMNEGKTSECQTMTVFVREKRKRKRVVLERQGDR